MPLYASGYSCRLAHTANPASSVPERDITTSADGKWVTCRVPPEPIAGGLCTIRLDRGRISSELLAPNDFDRVYIFENERLTGQNYFHLCNNTNLQSRTAVAIQYTGVAVPRDYYYTIDIVVVGIGMTMPNLPLGSANTLTKISARFTFRTDNPNRAMEPEARRDERMSMNWVPIVRKTPGGRTTGHNNMIGQNQGAYTSGPSGLGRTTAANTSNAGANVMNTPRPGLQTPTLAWFSQQQQE